MLGLILTAAGGRTDGGSIEQTIADSYLDIVSRPERPGMPPLPAGASLDDVVASAEQWNRATPADQQVISDSHQQLAEWKAHAEHLGVEVKTASDLLALRQMMG